MDINDCFKIGWIQKPHGLKGEVTVMLEDNAPAPEDWTSLKSVFLQQNQRLIPYFIESVSAQEKKAFIKFEDVDSAETAADISKQSIYLDKALRPKSGRGQFYDDEIIQFEVHDDHLGFLGTVEEIMNAGPNKLLVVRQDEKEVLIPVNGPFITGVNKSKKRMSVNLPEGFLDI